ncbi:MAG: hypothetical protein LCH54_13495 [Bacteroidetes bacterium]|nr:hypothetical protein [Bacteroidota bacterium]
MKPAIRVILFTFSSLVFSSCDSWIQHPEVEISSQSGVVKEYSVYRQSVTVTNTSNAYTAYNISIDAEMKSGSMIIAQGGASIGTLEPGESMMVDVIMTSRGSGQSQGSTKLILYWTDEHDRQWSKKY